MAATVQGAGPGSSVAAAARFLDRFEALPADQRARIPTGAFGSSAHTSAMLATADELTVLKSSKDGEQIGAFLVNAERRIDQIDAGTELRGLLKSAVRAVLVHQRPGLERSTTQLYSPFEALLPIASLSG